MFGQLEQFTSIISSSFSEPREGGFMFFEIPNSTLVGDNFDQYKTIMNDVDNSMVLVDSHTDSLVHFTHYRFIQTYKEVPVEGAGCIEHFDSTGSLVFTNAKHTVGMNHSHFASILESEIIPDFLLPQLSGDGLNYAWLDPDSEQQIVLDEQNNSATYYPVPELVFGIDSMRNINFNTDGSRYRLAYKIKVVSINPMAISTYFLDAHTGVIFRKSTHIHSDGPAQIWGYGTRTIDTEWRGFPHNNYRLYAKDATRNIHTKRKQSLNNTPAWGPISDVTDNDDVWDNTHLWETTTHYFSTRAWDFYLQRFGREGMDDDGVEVRVRTQWEEDGARHIPESKPRLNFGITATNYGYGLEPSIVAHEYTHGLIRFTADLEYEFESGALNESFCDIFGVVIQAATLDNGATDWIYGNSITGAHPRSLADPKSLGQHYDETFMVVGTGQPDTYNGQYWYSGTDLGIDQGGVHFNSGVQNHWFHILANGKTGVNDLNDTYNVNGIGMLKASWIAYYSLTGILQSSSHYADARLASITAAKILYGECSVEYQATFDAWYAVGIGNKNTCTYTLSSEEVTISEKDIHVYPNPVSDALTIEIPINANKNISIFDTSGKLVKHFYSDAFINIIDIDSFDTGMYTILFNIEGTIITKKIIKL